ncbi:hypothetical protein OAO72_08690, partial [Alphaproteobacteria bacterium]|nr:hypothetical protein [Alphaproteobacteria bacterium]
WKVGHEKNWQRFTDQLSFLSLVSWGGVSDAGISFYREALQGWGIHIYSAKIYRLNAKSGYRI